MTLSILDWFYSPLELVSRLLISHKENPSSILLISPGSMFGSILGGRWSDRTFKKLKAENENSSEPEVCPICSAMNLSLSLSRCD